MSDEETAALARVADFLSGGTLSLAFEVRNIVIAQGIQFTNADVAPWPDMVIPNGLTAPVASRTTWPVSMRTRAPLALTTTSTGFTYTDYLQGVRFVVKMVTTKDEYITALTTAGTHVIYHGHARYGRGPCFGILPTPNVVSATEDWENGTSPTTTGLFRMGYPYIGVPITEVLEHGYTCNLVSSSVTVTEGECDPDTRPHLSSLRSKLASEIDPGLPAQARDPDPTKRWWAYRAWDSGATRWHVLLNAGWTGTVSAPADLGATALACHVFCHFGCSSYRHNRKILRDTAFKGWAKSGDNNLAYFTTDLSPGPTTNLWLYHLFTYPHWNSYQDWEPSINYALNQTNADLALNGESFQLI